MHLFVVPTVNFSLRYAFVIVRLDRRALVWINVTQNQTAEWVARQLPEAFPRDEAPGYLVRNNNLVYGDVALRRIGAMRIGDKPLATVAPWQNGFAERPDRSGESTSIIAWVCARLICRKVFKGTPIITIPDGRILPLATGSRRHALLRQ